MPDYEKIYYHKALEKSGFDDGWRKYILDFIKNNAPTGAFVLELGCGEGEFSTKMGNSVNYYGIDVSEYALKQAAAKSSVTSAKFTLIDPDDGRLPFGDRMFDVAFGVYSLEHFKKPKEMIDEAVRVLKPGGHLIFLAPNLELPLSRLNAVRHKNIWYKVWLGAARICDYFFRIFGVATFRTLGENFTSATGRYEKLDDDLTYIVSSMEVINYLKKRHKAEEVFSAKMSSQDAGPGLKGKIRRMIALLPAMKYYGSVLFVVARKAGS
ncbi:MAG: class I SAM-dependent methyltransferase [Candidatus Pacebacteria bacterium]|nr:class I SAM-dependent methyltransferase [Candidatus Paceibacterota bacterium]NUQ57089.1 class I SAM-dependent methyltransferase [Candidatus Paceibacter sp.]